METISDPPATAENPAENSPAPENNLPAPENPAHPQAVNAVAETVTAEELLPKRKPGRPKGSTVENGAQKPRRKPDGRFAPVENPAPDNPPPVSETPDLPQFVSEIPGEPGPNGGAPMPEIPGTEPDPQKPPVDYHAMALMLVGMSTGILAKTIGPEWQPDDKQETDFLVSAVEAYLRVKETPDIPPGAMLLIAIGAYSAKRITQPATQSFLQRAKLRAQRAALWIKSKFSRRAPSVPFPNQTANAN